MPRNPLHGAAQVRVHEHPPTRRPSAKRSKARPWAQWRGAASAIEMDRRRAGAVLLGPARSAWWDGEAVRTARPARARAMGRRPDGGGERRQRAWLASEGVEGLWRRQGGRCPKGWCAGASEHPVQAWRWRCAIEHALEPAEYTCDRNAHHASLKLVSYAHTTSPLRRYADVIMQRAAYAVREEERCGRRGRRRPKR